MTTREALDEAIHSHTVDSAMSVLVERGVWMADTDTMSQAIHDVYCGMMADHDQPNDKDRDQARQAHDAETTDLDQQHDDDLAVGRPVAAGVHGRHAGHADR